MLETVREYAARKLREAGEEAGARERHLAFFLDRAEETALALTGPDPEAALLFVEAELGNFRAALAWSGKQWSVASCQLPVTDPARPSSLTTDNWQLTTASEAYLRLAAALWPFWEMRGHYTEGREHLRVALELPGFADSPRRAQALLGAATLALFQGRFEEARELGRQTLERFRALGEERGMAASLLLLGHLYVLRNYGPTAQALLEEGSERCRQIGWTQGSATASVLLGLAARHQNELTLTRSLLEQGRAMAASVEDASVQALALHHLGVLAMHTGDLDRARTSLENSLDIRRRLRNEHATSHTLHELGVLARLQQDLAGAVAYLEEAAAIHRKQGNRLHRAFNLHELGCALYEQGAYERARPGIEECLDVFKKEAGSNMIGCACNDLGSTLFHLGDPIRAQALHREALAFYQQPEWAEGIVWSLERIAVAEAAHGEARQAARLLGAASVARE
jgi:tetratricopeptide (TPR) repeat protein